MSRRVGRILTLTCPLPKQRKLDVAVVKLVLQANDSSYFYRGKTIQTLAFGAINYYLLEVEVC